MKIFLDVNVPFDVLIKRKPWYRDSAAVLSLLESDEFEGFVAARSITTLFYLSARKLGKPQATTALVDLDVEDALQAVSAVHSRADYLVTRNAADFKAASFPVVTPTELLAIVHADPGSSRSESR